ncbi:MAG: metal-dependent transcriptional regulator [Chloroflexi bacterium]|nr:metal-dependent transcriptional regulator [Chloroflexota bacterium]MBP7041425.1 metal-dependent transcriptional regulator [Chloroflexota bacterium]
MKHESFNESVEMYLKTVSELAAGNDLAPISALADRLGVSTVSATEMVHRLCEKGLLDHTPYKGVALTEDGRRRAQRVIRRHRLWECFLVDFLNLPWEKVHDYACRLEHATDTAVTEALAAFLNHPQTCPHGNPIPSAAGDVAAANDKPLGDLQPGDHGAITRIYPESLLLLDYLAARGILPGQPVEFEEIAPFNGPLMIKIGSETHALGQEIAAHIFTELTYDTN